MDYKLIDFPIHGNHEGKLVALEKNNEFPFEIKRVYYIWDPAQGLYITDNIWREFTNFSKDCVVMVLASEHYNPKDYIHDYHEFLKEVSCNR